MTQSQKIPPSPVILQDEIDRLNTIIKEKDAQIEYLQARINQRKHIYTNISEVPISILLKMRNTETTNEKLHRTWDAITKYNSLHPNAKINPTAKFMTRIIMLEDIKVKKWMQAHIKKISDYQVLHGLNLDGRNTHNMRYNRKDANGITELEHIILTIKNLLV